MRDFEPTSWVRQTSEAWYVIREIWDVTKQVLLPQTRADGPLRKQRINSGWEYLRGDKGLNTRQRTEEATGVRMIRRKRWRQGESGVVWTSGERDVVSGRKECGDRSQDEQDAWDTQYPALPSGHHAGASDTRSIFPNKAEWELPNLKIWLCNSSMRTISCK